MSFGQFAGFFLDTCILLPHPLEAITKACKDFLTENSYQCRMSSSVKEEAYGLIEKAHDLVVENFHTQLKPFLEGKGIKELTNRDGKIIADFFSQQKQDIRKQGSRRSNIPNEIMGAVENYVATALHSLEKRQKISVVNFLAALATQLGIIKHDMEAPFKGIKLVDIVPNDSIYSVISVNTIIRNPKDIEHLASALEYQFQENKWVVFVTTDNDEILVKAPELQEIFLQCSKPEWAVDYYIDLTRKKAPFEHIREIQKYTEGQKRIIEALEKATSLKQLTQVK